MTERYTDDVLRTALGESKRKIEAHGVEVTNMVMPYGGYGERTQELVDERAPRRATVSRRSRRNSRRSG